jgi:hypothetical protein
MPFGWLAAQPVNARDDAALPRLRQLVSKRLRQRQGALARVAGGLKLVGQQAFVGVQFADR